MSVVIPVFNGERFLAEAIQSVLDQTYEPVEVIAVDDGSTDGSAAIARSFAGVQVIEQPNSGPAGARNAGIAAARGEFLAFVDADDIVPPDKLELQVTHLREHPEVGCVLGARTSCSSRAPNCPAGRSSRPSMPASTRTSPSTGRCRT